MASGKVSATGYIIAAALAKLAKLPEWKEKFPEGMISLNNAFAARAGDSLTKSALALLPPNAALFLMDRLFVPGLVQHYLLRKGFIETQVRAAIHEGARQVINLGAGFDTLTLRLAKEFPAVEFFELDLPQTQNVKIRTLESIRHPLPANCNFTPVDLADTELKVALASHDRFNPDLPSCVIIEGVLMYLFEPEVKTLFKNLHTIFTSSLIVVYGATISSNRRAGWSVRAINLLLSRGNEGTKWFCPADAMGQFISELGFSVKAWVSYKQLQHTYRSEHAINPDAYGDEDYYVIEKK